MVQVVVFYVPRLREHPIHPIGASSPQTARKLSAVESTGDFPIRALRRVVTTVARVVTDHSPSRANRSRHHERRDRVHPVQPSRHVQTHHRHRRQRRQPAKVAQVRPRQNLLQVLHILLEVFRRLEFLLYRAHFRRPSREIEVLTPLPRLVVRHRRRRIRATRRAVDRDRLVRARIRPAVHVPRRVRGDRTSARDRARRLRDALTRRRRARAVRARRGRARRQRSHRERAHRRLCGVRDRTCDRGR